MKRTYFSFGFMVLTPAYALWGVALTIGLAAAPRDAHGAAGESIVRDPSTGDYLITYHGTGKPGAKKRRILRHAIFVPSTKIDPLLESAFKLQPDGSIEYSYRITNRKTSRQALSLIIFDPISDAFSFFSSKHWSGALALRRADGVRVGWTYYNPGAREADGMAPGETEGDFGFVSGDLPGIRPVQLKGDSPVLEFEDEGPVGEIGDQLNGLTQHDYVTRPGAVPAIPVQSPFDAASLLGAVQSNMHGWVGMSLLDSAFSAQLDSQFEAAIDACHNGQFAAAKNNIEVLRHMVMRERDRTDRKNEHANQDEQGKSTERVQIGLLAAQVLNFDLQYVLKQMDNAP